MEEDDDKKYYSINVKSHFCKLSSSDVIRDYKYCRLLEVD